MKLANVGLRRGLVTAVLFLSCSFAFAQRQYTITLGAKGQMRPELPERLFTNDVLKFVVSSPGENPAKYKKQLIDNLKKAVKNMDRLTASADKMALLTAVYDIKAADLDAVSYELKTIINAPNNEETESDNVPDYQPDSVQFYSVTMGKNPAKMAANEVSGPFPANTDDGQAQLGFTVTRTDPAKKMVFDWLGKTADDFPKPIDIKTFSDDMDALKKLVAAAGTLKDDIKAFHDERRGVVTDSDIPAIKKFQDRATQLNTDLGNEFTAIEKDIVLKEYKKWVLEWMWYQTSGLPSLNPLPFVSPDDLGGRPDTTEIAAIQDQITDRQTLLSKLNLKTKDLHEAGSLLATIDDLRRRIKSIRKAYAAFTANEGAATDFGHTSAQLNKGIFFTNEKDKTVNWMRHHDASKGQQLMNGLTREEYLETDRVVILDHNLTGTEKVSIHFSLSDIPDDQSRFAETLSPLITALAGVAGSFNVPRPNNNFTKTAGANVESELKILQSKINALNVSLKETKLHSDQLDYMTQQRNPRLDVKEATDESTGFHTEVANPAKKTNGPIKATYYLTVTNSAAKVAQADAPAADTFTYRIDKLYRLFPMAGVSWTFNGWNTVSYDSASHQSKVTTEKHLHFVIGLKVYLRKTDIRNSKFIWGKDDNGKCLFLSRTSIHLAFDAGSPLNNLYSGVGFDLWPGVCLSGGLAFNRYRYDQYAHGVIIKTENPYRTGLYMGLSTDLSLFTDVAKFLNLTK